MACPCCGSLDLAELIWGLMADPPDESEKVILGGCCVPLDEPTVFCRECRAMLVETSDGLLPSIEQIEERLIEDVGPDAGSGMLLSELLGEPETPQTLDEVLAEIDAVLGSAGPTGACDSCCDDGVCLTHYDWASEHIAWSWIADRTRNSLVIEWTIRAFISYRANIWNADEATMSEEAWSRMHDLDIVEQFHVSLMCDLTCAICRGDPLYLARIRASDLLSRHRPGIDGPG